MDQNTLLQLSALPKLGIQNRQSCTCKICGSDAPVFDSVDFNKFCNAENYYEYGLSRIQVIYYRCSRCRFIFTNFFDDWTGEEFSEFIYNEDYIKVDPEYAGCRADRDAVIVEKRLSSFPNLSVLDYGGGSGTFAERLRQSSTRIAETYDPFSSPERPIQNFDVLTCFEVLEHTPSPSMCLYDLRMFLQGQGCIIFGTGIQPPDIDRLRGNWWYIAPRNGHISIYSLESLALLARAAELVLYVGNGLAFGTKKPSAESLALLGSIGKPYCYIELCAPEDGSATDNADVHSTADFWHGFEANGSERFRWTKFAKVIWSFATNLEGPIRVKFAIPCVIAIRPGFKEACKIIVGVSMSSLSAEGQFLTATLDIDGSENTIALITPNLLKPSELGPVEDTRPLGLAIRTNAYQSYVGLADVPPKAE